MELPVVATYNDSLLASQILKKQISMTSTFLFKLYTMALMRANEVTECDNVHYPAFRTGHIGTIGVMCLR